MLVFVETNFVMEIALRRAGAPACEELLTLAEGRRLQLFIPAYSLVEPHEAMPRRHRERLQTQRRVAQEFKELSRSGGYEESVQQLDRTAALFARSVEDEQDQLERATAAIQSVAEVVPLTDGIITSGYVIQSDLGLGPQDSFVLASVEQHLDSATPSLFVTTNSKDFDDPDIVALLADGGCRMLWNFSGALGAIRAALGRAT